MKIKCVIFDFDGTLFDSMFLWENVGALYLHSLGKEAKPSLEEDIKPLSLHQSANYMKKEYQLQLSEDEILEGIHLLIEDFYLYKVQPKSGAICFLTKLKQAGISMCIATATPRYLIEAALKRCKMESFFEAIFTCDEVGHGKDEAIIFRKAMEHFHANRDNTVVFEDALHAITTAKKDGFFTVAVFDKSEEKQEEIKKLCDCYFKNFEDTDFFENI